MIGHDVDVTRLGYRRQAPPKPHDANTANTMCQWVTRLALFVVYFWFGAVKLLGHSEAAGLARALMAKTIGVAHFGLLFNGVAVLECVIGVLCLVPGAVRTLIALLSVHMSLVCAPLVLVPERTWQSFLVPTMEGQYIIKNVLIVAAAIGLATRARTTPLVRLQATE
jgi:uncharacterized membrane protein YkgB